MESKRIDWKDKKNIIIACSLVLNLILGGVALNYSDEAGKYQAQNESLVAENTDLQSERDALQIQVNETQPQIDELNAQVESLTGEKAALQKQVDSLTQTNNSLQSQVNSLKSSGGSSSGSNVSSAASTSTPQSRTVYITNTGSKYHQSGCRYLKKSKISISLSEAKSRGYSACSVCGG